MLKVKIKKLSPDAVIPTYAKNGDAGMDLTIISHRTDDCYTEYGTGLAIEIPEGFVGLVFPRSSISNKCQILANCVGVIDPTYRGEIKLRFKVFDELIRGAMESDRDADFFNSLFYMEGEKGAQLMIIPFPEVQWEEVEELSTTERGVNGFGSTTYITGDITTT